MIHTVEAVIDDSGKVKVIHDLRLLSGRRAIVTILDEKSDPAISETSLLSEETLATDWLRDEEEDAWSHLQSVQ